MEFLQITDATDYRATEIYNSYSAAFPDDERRSEVQFNQLFKKPNVKVFSVLQDLESVGYIIGWELSQCVFLEHFEIFSSFRSQKFGTEAIKTLFQNYSKILLEAEPERLDENAARRIEFYRRNGFEVIDENYCQPAYSKEKSPVKLWLLANYQPDHLSSLIEEINDVVYCRL